eukprot:gene53279-71232_t
MALAVVMQRTTIFQGDADHRFLGSCSRFVNGFWHFACFTMTKAYATLTVTNNDECRKTEALT